MNEGKMIFSLNANYHLEGATDSKPLAPQTSLYPIIMWACRHFLKYLRYWTGKVKLALYWPSLAKTYHEGSYSDIESVYTELYLLAFDKKCMRNANGGCIDATPGSRLVNCTTLNCIR